MRCRRCPESPDYTHAQLAAHAHDAQHPLCGVCQASLGATEPRTCTRCTQRVATHLADIDDAWQRLQETPHNQRPTGTRHTMPGGAYTVLVAWGSPGRTGGLGTQLSDGLVHDEHGDDEHTSDPPSVAHELASLEDDWRRARREPAGDGGDVAWVYRHALTYLQAHLQWAANTHDGFPDAADTLWRLRSRLHTVLGLHDRPETGAPCLNCSMPGELVPLERVYTDRGLSDLWLCPRCGDTHTQVQYLALVREALTARG